MRYLAIARYRLLTTIREATPIYIVAMLPPVGAAFVQTLIESSFRGGPDSLLAFHAQIALFAWCFHAAFLFIATEAFGSLKISRSEDAAVASDLMDSVPLSPNARFFGEMLGVFETTLLIHACCLPMLALVAALSPLPARVFLWLELLIIAVIALGSPAAAWKRTARPSKMSATRNLRSGILFLILVAAIFYVSTRWDSFRDAAFAFLGTPSLRAWDRVVATIENPIVLIVSIAALYSAYLAFYYVSSTRDPYRT